MEQNQGCSGITRHQSNDDFKRIQESQILHFNSIMVQLKRNVTVAIGKALLFQFHNGTIKTRNRYLSKEFQCDFNSIMVQLKHNIGVMSINEIRNFNSIMVQLKLIDIYNGNLVFTEVSLRINVYFFVVKMSMYNESSVADLRQHLRLIFIVKG